MKKIFLIITIIVCLTLTLVGCSNTTEKGSAWANKETLVYDVIEKNADGSEKVIGTMTTSIEVLQGEQTLNIAGSDTTTKYNLGTGTSGKRLTNTVYINGEKAMESQALITNWTSLASYKYFSYGEKNYSVSTRYEDGYVYYTKTVDGSSVEDYVNVGSTGYVDNEFIYTYLRIFSDLDTSMTQTVTTIDYDSMESASITISSKIADVPTFTFEGAERKCAEVTIQSSDSPVGLQTSVRYFTKDAYEKEPSGSSSYKSYRIPAEIIENNMIYRIKEVNVSK